MFDGDLAHLAQNARDFLAADAHFVIIHLSTASVLAISGFMITIGTYLHTSRKNRELQQRGNYLTLELEASRIFDIFFHHPEIWLYISGKLDENKITPEMPEKAYWVIPQILNVFEIITSFWRQKMIPGDVFATWVSWFHELGTAARFGDVWEARGLRTNYKADLRDIMDIAQDIRAEFVGRCDSPAALAEFHKRVAHALGDPSILQHLTKSLG